MNLPAIQTPDQEMPASVDLAIIGGGINGTAIAAMAAAAGLSVALLEAGDFGFGTTWRTTKLIHGGLRYLEHGDVPLVFESLHERSWLLKTRPYLVRPQRFVLPMLPWTRQPAWQLRTGLALYDALALYRGVPHHRHLNSARAHELMPALAQHGDGQRSAHSAHQSTCPGFAGRPRQPGPASRTASFDSCHLLTGNGS